MSKIQKIDQIEHKKNQKRLIIKIKWNENCRRFRRVVQIFNQNVKKIKSLMINFVEQNRR